MGDEVGACSGIGEGLLVRLRTTISNQSANASVEKFEMLMFSLPEATRLFLTPFLNRYGKKVLSLVVFLLLELVYSSTQLLCSWKRHADGETVSFVL